MRLHDTAAGSPGRARVIVAPHLFLWALGACVAGCGDGATSPDDAGGVDRDGADAAEGEVDVDVSVADGDSLDGGTSFSGEKLAFVATEVTLSAERLCDLDGDGVADNAIAELGTPGSDNAVMLWNALGEAASDDGYGPGLFFPVLADGGESVLIALAGDGTGLGGTLSAPYESMDGCGEPLYIHAGQLVDGGRLHLEAAEYPVLLSDAVAAGGARVTGTIEAGAERLSIVTEECLAPTIGSLGATLGPTQTRGRSLLEILLAGGSQLGMPSVPGLSPDLDLDGDGLERVLLDDDGVVRECVDGDSTVIAGRDCWADDRMADAFSLTRRSRYEETTFAGRLDDWLTHCDDGYPRPSLFGEEWNVVRGWQIVAGSYHSCLLDPEGVVRCWGMNDAGQLGYGHTETIGDDEAACVGGVVDLGEGALGVMAFGWSTCAILPGRRLRCWGEMGGLEPQIGDDETPASGSDLALGAPMQQLVAGVEHYCALLSGGRARCWGVGAWGQLGHGNTEPILAGDVAAAPDVPVGGRVASLAAGFDHTCALLEGGAVRCWGLGMFGQLGYGDTEDVGDDETPADVGDLDLGGPALAIAASGWRTCALLEAGSVRCWGLADLGGLGYGNTEDVGDDETPADVGDVPLGGSAVDVVVGFSHACALLESGALRCWGEGSSGALGYGSIEDVGDDERPAEAGDVDLGGAVIDVVAGDDHTCALLEGGSVRCWGYAGLGALGYGNVDDVGDDETPAAAGDVPTFCTDVPP